MAQGILKEMHWMVGADLHIPWWPGAPAPAPAPIPYLTGSFLHPTSATCLYAPTVLTDGGWSTMLRGTDIGPLIPHVGPASVTLPVEEATSGSKSHFGASSIEVRDQHGKPGNPAGAVLGLAGLNLNCGTPSPLPFGTVIAWTTVLESMRLGDVVAGIAGMARDYMLQRIVARVGELAAGRGARALEVIGERLGTGALGRVGARFAGASGRDTVSQGLDRLANGVRLWGATPLDFVIGSPLGPSISDARDRHDEVIFPSVLDRVTDATQPLGPATVDAVKAYLDDPSVADIPARSLGPGMQPARGE